LVEIFKDDWEHEDIPMPNFLIQEIFVLADYDGSGSLSLDETLALAYDLN